LRKLTCCWPSILQSFQDVLDNIFQPIFHATLFPEADPALTCFMNVVVGFDCVDDESRLDSPLPNWPKPDECARAALGRCGAGFADSGAS
jgi:AMP deaminase